MTASVPRSGAHAPDAPLAVDVSCSGLTVATASSSSDLAPVVAPVSVLAAADGSALPAGGDRLECSARVDELAGRHPDRCLADPVALAHRDRVDVAGLSVPTAELLAAPVARALRWAAAREGDELVLVVPTAWGAVRTGRLAAAATGLGVVPRAVRSALVTAEALPSSSARWTVCVEADAAGTTVSLVERGPMGLRLLDRTVVHRWDPCRDAAVDDEVARVLEAVTALRRARRGAGSGSVEVLARGRGAERVVDACDAARVLGFVVPTVAPVEAALRLGSRAGDPA